MKLVIAETGVPPQELRNDWPGYPAMFGAMFEGVGVKFDYQVVDSIGGEPVPEPSSGEALLVTGSPLGAYEEHAFIKPLEASIRAWAEARKPVIGICFGHQIIAQAFGGRVEKSERGWGVGVHTYEVVGEAPWGAGPSRFSCVVSHQDQVVELPPGFRRVAGSAFTPFGCLAHEELPVLTFQPHPEFDHGFASALMELRSDRIPAERTSLGQASLANGSDRPLMAQWIRDFVLEKRSS